MNVIKLLSLFSGIGAFEKALKNLNIDFELVGYSEIDKYASKAYALIHGVNENMNLGDITKINESLLPKNIDLITYGFPCQDISAAGKQKGFIVDGEKTRSGLFFDALRIIQAVKPKIAIAENVKNLTGKRFKNEFEIVLNSLRIAGYNNYVKVLNAKDYGVPQNRERVFVVSIRNDIDNKKFEFPQPIKTGETLENILESDAVLPILHNIYGGFGETKPRVFDKYAPTIRTAAGGGHIPSIWSTISKTNRKLTPKECFRLMGFDDSDIEILIKNKISNTQLYKMAGNSIVVNVLCEIFKSIRDTHIFNSETNVLLEETRNIRG